MKRFIVVATMLSALSIVAYFFAKTESPSNILQPYSSALPERIEIPQTKKSDAPIPQIAPTAVVPQNVSLSVEEKTQLYSAIEALASPGNLSLESRSEAMHTLGRLGDRALTFLCDEITKGNNSEADEELNRRIFAIDALNAAAKTKPFVVDRLFSFATSPSDETKTESLRHMDEVDKLEAFEVVSKIRPQDALNHIKSMRPGELRNKFSRHYVTGRKFSGIDEEKAISEVIQFVSELKKIKG